MTSATVARFSSADVNNRNVYNIKGELVTYNTNIIFMDLIKEFMRDIPESFPDAEMNEKYVKLLFRGPFLVKCCNKGHFSIFFFIINNKMHYYRYLEVFGSASEIRDEFDRIATRLEELNMPQSLCHIDLHPGNLIYDEDKSG